MEEQYALKFDTKKLFNSSRLQQYDEDGQKGFLGYLIKNEKMEIKNNSIVFPDITTEDKIEEKIKAYNVDTRKFIIKNNLQAFFVANIVGSETYQKDLEKEFNELNKNQVNEQIKPKIKPRYR